MPGVENESQTPYVSTGIKKAREAAAKQEALQRKIRPHPQGAPPNRQAFGELQVTEKAPNSEPASARQHLMVSNLPLREGVRRGRGAAHRKGGGGRSGDGRSR